jgi:hypothetical protein
MAEPQLDPQSAQKLKIAGFSDEYLRSKATDEEHYNRLRANRDKIREEITLASVGTPPEAGPKSAESLSIMDPEWWTLKAQKERAPMVLGNVAAAAAPILVGSGGAGWPAAAAAGGISGVVSAALPQPETTGGKVAELATQTVPGMGLAKKSLGLTPRIAGQSLGAGRTMLAHALEGAVQGSAQQAIAGGIDQATGQANTPMFSPWATGGGGVMGGGMGLGASVGARFTDPRLRDLYSSVGVSAGRLKNRITGMMEGQPFVSGYLSRLGKQENRWNKMVQEIESELANRSARADADVTDLQASLKLAQARAQRATDMAGHARRRMGDIQADQKIHQTVIKNEYAPVVAQGDEFIARTQAQRKDIMNQLSVLREQRAQQRGQQGGGWTPEMVGLEPAQQAQSFSATLDKLSKEEISAATALAEQKGYRMKDAVEELYGERLRTENQATTLPNETEPDPLTEAMFPDLDPQNSLDAQILDALTNVRLLDQQLEVGRMNKVGAVVGSVMADIDANYRDKMRPLQQQRNIQENVQLPKAKDATYDATKALILAESRRGKAANMAKAFQAFKDGKLTDLSIFHPDYFLNGRVAKMEKIRKRFLALGNRIGADGVPDEFMKAVRMAQTDPMTFYRNHVLSPEGADFIRRYMQAHRGDQQAQQEFRDAILEQWLVDSYDPNTHVLAPELFKAKPKEGQGLAQSGAQGMTREKIYQLFGGPGNKDATAQVERVVNTLEMLSSKQNEMWQFAKGAARHAAYWTLPHAILFLNPASWGPGIGVGLAGLVVGASYTKLIRKIARDPRLYGEVVDYLEFGLPGKLKLATYPALSRFLLEEGEEVDGISPAQNMGQQAEQQGLGATPGLQIMPQQPGP